MLFVGFVLGCGGSVATSVDPFPDPTGGTGGLGCETPTSWFVDADGDGFGDATQWLEACASPGSDYTDAGGDCDDADDAIHPEAPEAEDGIDNDCDEAIDEDWIQEIFTPTTVTDTWATPCGGDGEFDGNGPDVSVAVQLSNLGDAVELVVDADWLETQSDWTCGRVNLVEDAGFEVPIGCEILSIEDASGRVGNVLSEVVSYTDLDHDLVVTPGTALILEVSTHGDGPGDDIGTSADDAQISSLVFRSVNVRLHCPGS